MLLATAAGITTHATLVQGECADPGAGTHAQFDHTGEAWAYVGGAGSQETRAV